jgi:hypothetical protein
MKKLLFSLVFIPSITFSQCWYFVGYLSAVVQGDTVTLKDDTANRNCGASYYMRVYQYSADTITWIQEDDGEAFGCRCTYDLSVKIDSLHPQHYYVKIYYNEIEGGGYWCYVGMIEFDITKPNSYQWGTKINENQSVCFAVGTNELPDRTEDLMVYPNPASSKVSIKTGNSENKIIRIADMNGVNILEMQSNQSVSTIDVQDFTGGVYFVSVIQDKIVYTRKFCKL